MIEYLDNPQNIVLEIDFTPLCKNKLDIVKKHDNQIQFYVSSIKLD